MAIIYPHNFFFIKLNFKNNNFGNIHPTKKHIYHFYPQPFKFFLHLELSKYKIPL
jgi:hypothetical protein